MEAKLRQAYGAWPKGPALKEEEIELQPAKPGYYLVEKEDVNQSSINMVGVGITRDNPDYYAVRVFNEAFGGGFSSRLFRAIRTEKGLAYARRRRNRKRFRSSRHRAPVHGNEERHHDRIDSGAR